MLLFVTPALHLLTRDRAQASIIRVDFKERDRHKLFFMGISLCSSMQPKRECAIADESDDLQEYIGCDFDLTTLANSITQKKLHSMQEKLDKEVTNL